MWLLHLRLADWLTLDAAECLTYQPGCVSLPPTSGMVAGLKPALSCSSGVYFKSEVVILAHRQLLRNSVFVLLCEFTKKPNAQFFHSRIRGCHFHRRRRHQGHQDRRQRLQDTKKRSMLSPFNLSRPLKTVFASSWRSISSAKLTIERTTDTANYDNAPAPEKLKFGATISDHMLMIEWDKENLWGAPRIVPYAELRISPAASCLHYGKFD